MVSNRIPEEIIEEIRLHSDIVETISEYISLQRRGKLYLGLCPFHAEKTPSFTVSPDKQMFYCFGCHEGGNVFSFLMKKENWTFIETVQRLAQKHGILLPEKELSSREQEEQKHRRRWVEIHEWAAGFFQTTLMSDDGRPGQDYFTKRGLDKEAIQAFRLGYAPDRWDSLIKFMHRHGVKEQELVDAGLALERESAPGQFYDRFRNRVIFSIINVRGEVIGFGGRVLDDALPKYLNSPETAYFSKGQHLFGLNTAYQGIRQRGFALLVEGYMDVIAVQKGGFTNTVASLGTALTRDQARLLRRYTTKVVLAYDSDAAGVQAALRAGEILQDSGLRVDVLVLPEGKDPDEFLKIRGQAAFRDVVDNAKTYVEFKYLALTKEAPPRTIHDKADLIARLAPDILRVPSPAEREGYERFLALELGLTLDAVQREIQSQEQKSRRKGPNQEYYSNKQDISVKNRDNTIRYVEYSPVPAVPQGIYRAERILLRVLIEYPDFKARVIQKVSADDFWKMPEHQAIYSYLNPDDSSPSPAENISLDDWPSRVRSEYASLMMEEVDLSSPEKLLDDCFRTIRSLHVEESIEDLQAKMADLEKSGDQAGAMALLREIGERLKRGK